MLRLAVICDFPEEAWPSMDLVGDMLLKYVQEGHSSTVEADRVQPHFRRRITALRGFEQLSAARNTDRLWNRMVEYPRWLRTNRDRYDLFHIVDHSYSHLALELPRNRTIVTCHDLDTFRCLLEPSREARPRWFRRMAQHILKGFLQAAHIVFVSETVRQEAIGFSLTSEERSSVIYNGVSGAVSNHAAREAESLLDGNPEGPLLLHVGSTIPRKRIDLLLRIFASLRVQFPSIRLVRVGGPFTQEQQLLARRLDVEHAIIHLPFLQRATLTEIYQRATLLLQPSEAEGFGLPLIEAMACGCPVVASDLPVLREIGGTAATYCRIGDVSAWTQSVRALLTHHAEQSTRWKELRNHSVKNTSRFSWRAAADNLVGLYQNLSSNTRT